MPAFPGGLLGVPPTPPKENMKEKGRDNMFILWEAV